MADEPASAEKKIKLEKKEVQISGHLDTVSLDKIQRILSEANLKSRIPAMILFVSDEKGKFKFNASLIHKTPDDWEKKNLTAVIGTLESEKSETDVYINILKKIFDESK
ncbi:MAG: hypothetical protein WCX64_03915 [Candidatus Micrarchaeia archaeon]